MNDAIALHHRLEAEVYRLRLLRDLKNPEFSAEKEDAVLDAMEEAWLRLSAEDRRVLEAERIVRDAGESFPQVLQAGFPSVDVDEDSHLRRCMPPRMAAGVR